LKGASDVTSNAPTINPPATRDNAVPAVPRNVTSPDTGWLKTLAGRCARYRYEIAPAAGNIVLTGLAWTEYAGGTGWSAGLSYSAATLACGTLAGFALKHKHQHLAAGGAGLAAVLPPLPATRSTRPG
jgi:hypothetical protein